MQINRFLCIFLRLIFFYTILSNINIFPDNNKVEIRNCCRCCNSCKKQDDKIITNKFVKQLRAVEGKKTIIKDKEGKIIKTIIADKSKNIDKMIQKICKNNGNDNINITSTTIALPEEEYYDSTKNSISNSPESELIDKISKCPLGNSENNNENNNTKTIEFETIKKISKNSIKILKDIHTEHINSNYSYLKTDKNELSFHYIRYVVRGNIVDILKTLLFGKYEENKCWQIEVLTNNGTEGEVNNNISPQFSKNNILKEINFTRTTKKAFINAIHEVKNNFLFKENTNDSFVCTVKSSATSVNDWIKNPLGSIFNKTGAIPDVDTDIVYSAKYDKEINTTFFITLATFHYKGNDFGGIIPKQIKEQAKNTFTSILGEKFSEKLKNIVNEKFKKDDIQLF